MKSIRVIVFDPGQPARLELVDANADGMLLPGVSRLLGGGDVAKVDGTWWRPPNMTLREQVSLELLCNPAGDTLRLSPQTLPSLGLVKPLFGSAVLLRVDGPNRQWRGVTSEDVHRWVL